MNVEIKDQVMKTYATKIKSMTGQTAKSVIMMFNPEVSDDIMISIRLENHPDIEEGADTKDSLFLKRLMIPKLKKEIKKKEGAKKVDFSLVTCLMEFEQSKITLFAEYNYYTELQTGLSLKNTYVNII